MSQRYPDRDLVGRKPSPPCNVCGMPDGAIAHSCKRETVRNAGHALGDDFAARGDPLAAALIHQEVEKDYMEGSAENLAALDFREWWNTRGQYMDPDTEDVPWFDKRKPLSQAAYYAGRDSRAAFRNLTMDMLYAVVDLMSDPDCTGIDRDWLDQWKLRAESALQADPGTLPPEWRVKP